MIEMEMMMKISLLTSEKKKTPSGGFKYKKMKKPSWSNPSTSKKTRLY